MRARVMGGHALLSSVFCTLNEGGGGGGYNIDKNIAQ